MSTLSRHRHEDGVRRRVPEEGRPRVLHRPGFEEHQEARLQADRPEDRSRAGSCCFSSRGDETEGGRDHLGAQQGGGVSFQRRVEKAIQQVEEQVRVPKLGLQHRIG
eukprot:14158434-Heterocapsa_arctica.AAC.1